VKADAQSERCVHLARCFLRLANLPNYALDRLSRYEATLWRQVGRILFALDALVVANHKREGAVSVSVVGNTCWPTGATTIEPPITLAGRMATCNYDN